MESDRVALPHSGLSVVLGWVSLCTEMCPYISVLDALGLYSEVWRPCHLAAGVPLTDPVGDSGDL